MENNIRKQICKYLDNYQKYAVKKGICPEELEQFKMDNNLVEKRSGWYVDNTGNKEYKKWLCYFDLEKKITYGINCYGMWFYNGKDSFQPLINSSCTRLSEEEVVKRLKPFAEKMGYKAGARIKSLCGRFSRNLKNGNYFLGPNSDLFFDSYCLMRNGVWAEIVKKEKVVVEKNQEIVFDGYTFTMSWEDSKQGKSLRINLLWRSSEVKPLSFVET